MTARDFDIGDDEITADQLAAETTTEADVAEALGAGALLVGALARIAFRRWRASREQRSGRRRAELPDVRAEPHTRPVEVSVEPVPDGTRTVAVRLEPHADPGIQTLQEVT